MGRRTDPEAWLATWQPPPTDVSRYGNRVDQPVRTRQAKPGSSLADKVPSLVAEWDHEQNGDVTPSTIGASSSYPAWWRCRRNTEHRWQQSVTQRSHTDHGKGCPWCLIDARLARRRVSSNGGLSVRSQEYRLAFSDRNPLPLDEASDADEFDWLWVCPDDHEFVASPAEIERGFACGRCWVRQQWVNKISQRAKIGGVFSLDRPRQRSKEELKLAAELAQVFPVDFKHDAVRVRGYVVDQPFVTPDVLIPDLQIAVEWDGAGHRLDPELDRSKEEVLAEVGWRTIRASVDATESVGDIVAAPKGLNLGVVGMVMDLVASSSPGALDAVARWRRLGRWQGKDLYEELVERAGTSAQGASAWRYRRS